MEKSIEKTYSPAQVEEKWYKFWTEKGYFHAEPDKNKKPYTIVIPPPNVTAALHMGHAFNNTIQDILIRYHRKKGFETLWLPGTDHAGIATQNVVEKQLRNEGKTKHQLGREKFVATVWDWKEKYGNRIIYQLKKMGCSCDWERERFTMDEGLTGAVQEVFIKLYEKGLIYRGNYIINWCPRCETALSDEEVEYEAHSGHLWHMKYPVKDSNEFVVVATTRPETMLGDTAVAVHPDDERYKELVGKKIILPLVEREIPVIADEHVDPEFGTGAVKVTPAHDPNDFEIGKRHELPSVKVIDIFGKMNDNAGKYKDMDRFAARKAIIKDLDDMGLLVKTEDHQHNVGHCHRCSTVIEPYQSTQWFVKMKPLAEMGIAAVKDGRVKLHPEERWLKTYMNWMENIRDWCISRQLWWGHRIPVYYCEKCGAETAAKKMPEKCSSCGHTVLKQDEDVLDTWFSSWLWPFSTMGWPEKTGELEYFYPTQTLVTGPDIIFFWVARMIMAGMEFMGDVPFKDVLLNGIVRDAKGRKMSKSLGNGIDPVEIIEKYSADAMRFTMIMLSAEGKDLNVAPDSFEMGRNFSNKLWNSFRFVMMNVEEELKPLAEYEKDLDDMDKWILSRLNYAVKENERNLDNFRIHDSLDAVYHFFWHEYCDWYLEMIKSRLYDDAAAKENKDAARAVSVYVLKQTLELLHPYIPFITEEIWQQLPYRTGESIVVSEYPQVNKGRMDEKLDDAFHRIMDMITAIRNVRAEMNIPPAKKAIVFYRTADTELKKMIEKNSHAVKFLAKLQELKFFAEQGKPQDSMAEVSGNVEIFIELKGLIDINKEKERLTDEIAKAENIITRLQAKLNNENFVNRAPEAVVNKEKEKLKGMTEKLEKLKINLENL